MLREIEADRTDDSSESGSGRSEQDDDIKEEDEELCWLRPDDSNIVTKMAVEIKSLLRFAVKEQMADVEKQLNDLKKF